jgi:hypothetical protein
MFWTKTILVLGLTAFFAQSGDMPPVPVAKQTEEFALKARREGQLGLQIPIPPDLFAKVTETISVYPTICDAPIAPVCMRTVCPRHTKARKRWPAAMAGSSNIKYEDEDGRILRKSFPEDPPA